jgi:hypothetical protein
MGPQGASGRSRGTHEAITAVVPRGDANAPKITAGKVVEQKNGFAAV